jgi:uncharacterized protein YndB with AHSA1/START domain
MGRTTSTIAIARPIEVVFRVVSRVDDFPAWMPQVSEAALLDPKLETGSRIRLRLGPPGGGTAVTGTITALEPPHILAVGGSGGPLRIAVQAVLAAIDGETRIDLAIDVEASPLLGFIVREADQRISAELPAALDRLRALAEAETA